MRVVHGDLRSVPVAPSGGHTITELYYRAGIFRIFTSMNMASIIDRFGETLSQLQIEGTSGGDPNDLSIARNPPLPLSEREVTEIEQILGVTLPTTYKQFLLEIGGA